MIPPSLDEVQRAVGDRYQLLDLAGAGGMGAVFRARHLSLGHIVAVKVLPPEVATSQMRQERFKREASLAAHLSHPNIVPVYEFDTRAGLSFLIMPFVRGVTFESVLDERRRLDVADALRVVREVGAALDFAHQRGVVHRDVKPSNIMIEQDTGRALLTDFGVARVERPGDGGLTVPGTPIGTPDYMAPEQLAGGDAVDGRADLYALGLIAYEALTGTLPSLRADRAQLARALRAAQPGMPAALATALVAPLAERPPDRPASAGAWLDLMERARRQRRRRRAQTGIAVAALLGAGWYGYGRLHQPEAERTMAVMPFAVHGDRADLPPGQLTDWFTEWFADRMRLTGVSGLQIHAAATVRERAKQLFHAGALTPAEAESLAASLRARYYLQGSAEFVGSRLTLQTTLYETGGDPVRGGRGDVTASADSVSSAMDAAWAQVLRPLVGPDFALTSAVTLPTGLEALVAYRNAEVAFRQGDYDRALEEYNRVIAQDSGFALARFRRALVVAQVDPTGERVVEALRGARQHQAGLSPADSLMLQGYTLLVERGDGEQALKLLKLAAGTAPDQPIVWFVLGEFYTHFGMLFDQSITEAEMAFNRVRDLVPQFAPAIAHLISLTYLRGDAAETKRLMDEYRKLDSTSVVAEVIGIADTALFGSGSAKLHLINVTLERRRFEVLAFLAFQAATVGSDADRQGPGRRVLLALERRAASEAEAAQALRMGLAADLRYGWADSARARVARASAPAAQRERDAWYVLARAAGLPELGDWRVAAERVAGRLRVEGDSDAVALWLLAVAGNASTRARHGARLRALAADSSPLALSLTLDLEARRRLGAGNSAGALALWDSATTRYEVLSVPFGLVASLWPLRLEIARAAAQARDSLRARRACDTFTAPIGYVDQVALPEIERLCAPSRGVAAGNP